MIERTFKPSIEFFGRIRSRQTPQTFPKGGWSILLSFLLFTLSAGAVQALSPIVQWNDLVAGQGEPGFKDGEFYRAHFNSPAGLAISPDGGTLYLADRGNHRLRAVDLKNRNRVSTLAGTGVKGHQNGPALKATFNNPALLSLLPNDKMAIWDQGNLLIRLLDLKAGILSTFVDLSLPDAQGGEIWNMVYYPNDGGLYFSQPAEGLLRRLDLKTGQVSNIFKNLPDIPHPSALAIFKGHLQVADRDSGKVFNLDIILTPNAPAKVDARPNGSASHILAMAATGDNLYAFQTDANTPLARVIPPDGPVSLRSLWGYPVSNGNHLLSSGTAQGWATGFVADPNEERRFYLTNSTINSILSFRDLHTGGMGTSPNSFGLYDSEYSVAKPPHTFRILLLGRSFLIYDTPNLSEGWTGDWKGRMDFFAKKMELSLNTLAALEDSPWRYEVFNGGKIHEMPLYVWPYYEAPPLVEKYDIDLTVVMMDPAPDYSIFLRAPLTAAGIPTNGKLDPEFMLKPYQERFSTGLMKRFLDTGQELKLITVTDDNKLEYANFEKMITQPRMEDIFIEMKGKSLGLLNDLLRKKRAGKLPQPPFLVCVFPLERGFDFEIESDFWAKTSQKYGFPLMDLTDAFTALKPTYFPYGEDAGVGDHLGPNGHFLMSFILTHELIKSGMIPFSANGKSNPLKKPQP